MRNMLSSNSNPDDFTLAVPASSLRLARSGLSEMAGNKFLPTEFALSMAAVAVGALLTAVQRGVECRTSDVWWLYYCVMPAIALGGVVAYFLLKYFSGALPAARARDLLGIVPDPDKATQNHELERLAGEWKLESSTQTSGKVSTGVLTLDVTGGRITAAGQLYGESDRPIAAISSEICDYQPRLRQFLLVYLFSAHNDNGRQLLGRCILNGMLFDKNGFSIKGNWFHLQDDSSGCRPCGNATLTRIEN